MKIVITGAAGHLGTHLVPLLIERGYAVVGLDMVEPTPSSACDFVRVSLSERERLPALLSGADAVVHAASIHPWKKYRDEEYLDANIKGTWQLYAAALEAGVRAVVLTSSIAAVGYHDVPLAAWPVGEESRFPIGDIYSLTKQTQEEVARHFAVAKGISTYALRPPAFMPRPSLETGFALTANFCVVDDIARAHLAALDSLLAGGGVAGSFEAFFTVNRLPYQPEDAVLLTNGKDVSPLVEKYWPELHRKMTVKGYTGARISALYDISKAERLLGWTPRYNFDEWVREHLA